jgi:hypothetical protein
VPTGGVDPLHVGHEVGLAQVFQLLLEHFGVADHGVERRPQLVAHVRQELGLVLASFGESATGLLHLLEQPGVLNRQHRMTGERLEQLDDGPRELAGPLPTNHERADDALLTDQRDGQQGAEAGVTKRVEDGAGRQVGPVRKVRHLDRLTAQCRSTDHVVVRQSQATLLDRQEQLSRHAIGRPGGKGRALLI